MWRMILNFLTSVFTLTERLERQERGLKELERDVKELTAVVQRLVIELERLSEREASEREKFMLRVENQLLKAGRQLPASTPSNEDK